MEQARIVSKTPFVYMRASAHPSNNQLKRARDRQQLRCVPSYAGDRWWREYRAFEYAQLVAYLAEGGEYCSHHSGATVGVQL